MLGASFFWLLLVLGIGIWWQRLLLSQAAKIAELEHQLLGQSHASNEVLARTQNMLFWESTTFLVLVAAVSVFLMVLHLREQLRARSLEAFFASVTHELRTPLTSIRLQAESIVDSLAGVTPEQGVLADRLMEDLVRLETQVERVLELARVEGGGSVYLQPLELEAWLERTVQILSSSYGERVEFQWVKSPTHELDDHEHAVLADASSLQIVLRNLVENAVRHSGLRKVKVFFSISHADAGELLLQVWDNGKGIRSEDVGSVQKLGKLFQKGKFSQGAGVGLYLVKALMERMRGGAEFCVHEGGGFETRLRLKEAGNLS